MATIVRDGGKAAEATREVETCKDPTNMRSILRPSEKHIREAVDGREVWLEGCDFLEAFGIIFCLGVR